VSTARTHPRRPIAGRPAAALPRAASDAYLHRKAADGLNARAIELFRDGKLDAAVEAWRAAVRIADDGRYRVNLCAALCALGDFAAAADEGRAAARLAPRRPESWDNLGVALKELADYDASIAAHREAVRLDPSAAAAVGNLATALTAAGRLAEAADACDELLRVGGDPTAARFGRGLARLAMGDFKGGWADFELRLDRPACLARQIPGVPRWDGSPIAGTLLLNALTDGSGDAIQCARWIPAARRRCGRTLVLCEGVLARLMADVAGVDAVVCDPKRVGAIECQTSVHGLPAVLGGLEPDASMVPYLRPREEIADRWATALAGLPGCKVGVLWQGDPSHSNDRRRSFRLKELAPLAAVPGVSLVSLQRGRGAEQLDAIDFRVHELGLDFAVCDLAESAAVLDQLDLVIGPDTGMMHLAGALGVPAWIALASPAPDWRWLRDRDDSPWYPSVRLFRQATPGDWPDVFRRMAAALGG